MAAASSRLPFQQQHGSRVCWQIVVTSSYSASRCHQHQQTLVTSSAQAQPSRVSAASAADLDRRGWRSAASQGRPLGQAVGTGIGEQQAHRSLAPASPPQAQGPGQDFRPGKRNSIASQRLACRLCGASSADCTGRRGFQLQPCAGRKKHAWGVSGILTLPAEICGIAAVCPFKAPEQRRVWSLNRAKAGRALDACRGCNPLAASTALPLACPATGRATAHRHPWRQERLEPADRSGRRPWSLPPRGLDVVGAALRLRADRFRSAPALASRPQQRSTPRLVGFGCATIWQAGR